MARAKATEPVSSSFPSWPELMKHVESRGEGALLRTPVAEVCAGRPCLAETEAVLAELLRANPAAVLTDLMTAGRKIAPGGHLRLLVVNSDILRLASDFVHERQKKTTGFANDALALAPRIAAGMSAAQLARWLRDQELAFVLTPDGFHLVAAAVGVPAAVAAMGVTRVVLPPAQDMGRGAGPLGVNPYRRLVVEELERLAREHAEGKLERQSAPAFTSPDPGLQPFVDRLVAALAERYDRLYRPARLHHHFAIRVLDEMESVIVSVASPIPRLCKANSSYTFSLVDPIRPVGCQRCQIWPFLVCDVRSLAMAAILDAVCIEGRHALIRDMVEFRNRPWWRDLVPAPLLGAVPEEPPVRTEFGLRVCLSPEGHSAEVVKVRPKKAGFTLSRVPWIEQSDDPLAPEDVDMQMLLWALRSDTRAQLTRALLARVLLRSPRVFLEGGPPTPLPVRRGQLVLAFVPTGNDQVEARLEVDGVPLPWENIDGILASWPQDAALVAMGPPAHLVLLDPDPHLRGLLQRWKTKSKTVPLEAVDTIAEACTSYSTPVRVDASLVGQVRDGNPTPVVRLERRTSSLGIMVSVRPGQGPMQFAPGEGPVSFLAAAPGDRHSIFRDLAEERRLALALPRSVVPMGPDGVPIWSHELDGDSAAAALLELQEVGERCIIEWRGSPLRVARADDARGVRLSVSSLSEWLGVKGHIQAGDVEVPIEAALAALRLGERWIKVGPEMLVRIGDELQNSLAPAADACYAGARGVEMSPLALTRLFDLQAHGAEVSGLAAFQERFQKIGEAAVLSPPLPPALTAELRPYQLDGFTFLARLAHWCEGAVLADDMGLGKTVQCLALLAHRAALGPALVVAPTSVGWNWVREAEKFVPTLPTRLLRGTDRQTGAPGPHEVLVTSYDLMVRDAETLAAVSWSTVVFDEAQNLKNPATRRARAARELRADFRVALTGTPVENRVGELWSILRCTVPPLLGSWERFWDRFGQPIERHRDRGVRMQLAGAIRPFLLRRLKREVAKDLPPRTEVVVTVDLSTQEERLYSRVREAGLTLLTAAARSQLSGAEAARLRVQALTALLRMRQAACHPRLVEPESPASSAKLAVLLDMLAALSEEGEKALVFSQFTSLLDLVEPALRDAGVEFLRIDGSTPEPERRARVDKFQGGEVPVFLLSLKAGGTGLNLTAATTVIHLDPWWNPASEDQATDRAHRIGQHRPVTVYRIVARGTVEERILTLHDDKRELAEALIEGADTAHTLSVDQLVALMREDGPIPLADEVEAEEGAAPKRRAERVDAGEVRARVRGKGRTEDPAEAGAAPSAGTASTAVDERAARPPTADRSSTPERDGARPTVQVTGPSPRPAAAKSVAPGVLLPGPPAHAVAAPPPSAPPRDAPRDSVRPAAPTNLDGGSEGAEGLPVPAVIGPSRPFSSHVLVADAERCLARLRVQRGFSATTLKVYLGHVRYVLAAVEGKLPAQASTHDLWMVASAEFRPQGEKDGARTTRLRLLELALAEGAPSGTGEAGAASLGLP